MCTQITRGQCGVQCVRRVFACIHAELDALSGQRVDVAGRIPDNQKMIAEAAPNAAEAKRCPFHLIHSGLRTDRATDVGIVLLDGVVGGAKIVDFNLAPRNDVYEKFNSSRASRKIAQ